MTLSPAWLQVLGNAMLSYSVADAEACSSELGRVWKTVWAFLESKDAATRKSAAEALDMLSQCFTAKLIASAIHEAGPEANSTLSNIIAQTTRALDSLAYARSMPELLMTISSLINGLRHRVVGTSTAAESLLLPLIQKVGALRVQKGFEYKEAADSSLTVAMRVLGPEVLLRALPLNLEPSDRYIFTFPRSLISAHPPLIVKLVSSLEPIFFLSWRNPTHHLWVISCLTLFP